MTGGQLAWAGEPQGSSVEAPPAGRWTAVGKGAGGTVDRPDSGFLSRNPGDGSHRQQVAFMGRVRWHFALQSSSQNTEPQD